MDLELGQHQTLIEMSKSESESKVMEMFFQFFFDQLPARDFESWLYTASDVEKKVGAENYLELVSLDYDTKEGVYRAKEIIRFTYDHLSTDTIFRDRARLVAKSMLDGDLSIVMGCRILANLSMDGFEFVPGVFVAYSGEYDRLKERVANDAYKERILRDVHLMLADL
jgi:hypothetical protein